MFHKASIRLAGLYLLIIMAISLFFSFNVYRLSTNEINRGYQKQGAIIDRLPVFDDLPIVKNKIENEWESQLSEAKRHVLNQLILINLFILMAGGFLSYFMARSSLLPIEEVHESQSRFTADASHELRTPIAAMRSEIEVALLDPSLTLPEAKEQLKSNLEELQKITDLTSGLLRLAQLDKIKMQDTNVQISKLLASCVKQLHSKAETKNILIKIDADKSLYAKADRSTLAEAVVAIVDNAIKYSPAKSTIRLNANKKHHDIVLEIQDRGPGIKSEDQQHIFERFYRADSARSKTTSGYGLGLAIAHDIIKMQNGSISVKSKEGKGTTFIITLPSV